MLLHLYRMKHLIILFLSLPVILWGQRTTNTFTLPAPPDDYKPNYPYILSTNTHETAIPNYLGKNGLLEFEVFINESGVIDSISIQWLHTVINHRTIDIYKNNFPGYRYLFSLYEPYILMYLKSAVKIKKNDCATPHKSNVVFLGVYFNDSPELRRALKHPHAMPYI